MKLPFFLILTALAALVRPAAAEFYSVPWTNDASAGVSAATTVWAYNFGTASNATINGVIFTGVTGTTPSVANRFAVAGTSVVNNADVNNLTTGGGGSAALATDFIWGGNPTTITLSGLTVGQVYSFHMYGVGWDSAPTVRNAVFASGTESALHNESRLGDNNGHRITYAFSSLSTTKTITITPVVASTTWHLYGIALTTGPTFVPVTPTATASSAVSGAFALANAVDGTLNEFRSTAGGSTFIEFDFGHPRTVDTFVNVTTSNTTIFSPVLGTTDQRIGNSRLIFDTDGTAGFNATTDAVVNFNEANTGFAGFGWVNRFTPVTAAKARWEVVSLLGTPVAGTMEMAFLQSPTGSVFIPTGPVYSASPAFNSDYSTGKAWDGVAGRYGGVNAAIEYASAGAGAGMFAVFDLGSSKPVTGFDYFDRMAQADMTSAFDILFLDEANNEIPSTRKSYTKTTWLKSDHFAPITCRRIRLQATAGSGNTGIGEIVIYRDNPAGADVTLGLAARLPLDATSGTLADDLQSTNNGTLNGSPLPTWQDTALKLNGNTSRVDLGWNMGIGPSPTAYPPITITMWVKPDAAGLDTSLRTLLDSGHNVAPDLGLFFGKIQVGESFWGNNIAGGTAIAGGQWVHLAWTLTGDFIPGQGTGITAGLYVNGVADGGGFMSGAAWGNPMNYFLGYDREDPADSYAGLIKDFRVYTRTLSETEIQSVKAQFTPPGPPSVIDPSAPVVAASTATLRANVAGDGGAAVTERGFVFARTSQNATPRIDGANVTKVVSTPPGTTGLYTADVAGLLPVTGYSFCGYAKNSNGTAYTIVSTFTTTSSPPVVSTPVSSLITHNTATLGGTVDSDGGGAVTERGVVYALSSTNNNPLINGSGVTKVTAGGTTGPLSAAVSGLPPATGYTFKAYAINAAGTSYSAIATFTTRILPPTVTASAAGNIDVFSATLNGTVTTDGGTAVTERGFVYAKTSANANPEVGGTGVTKVSVSGQLGAYQTELAEILEGTTSYTFRAYATNSGGQVYAYSAALTFTTLTPPPPTFADFVGNAGLWIGEVELNEVVSHAETPRAWRFTPAPFRYTIIMHVNSQGYARLLPEATLMQTREVTPRPVIVTLPAQLANYDGITPRGGKQVGQRWSATNFPPPAGGVSLSYDGSYWISGSVTLSAAHPLNPFRHKYHPDLANGRPVTRNYAIQANPGDSRSDHVWSGTIYDLVDGLNKNRMESRGTVTFTRVSTAGKLNQP
jgi:hypothetical protein